jgi:hypothetical protein
MHGLGCARAQAERAYRWAHLPGRLGGQWFWCLKRPRTVTGCGSRLCAHTRKGDAGAQAQVWRERGPLKPGEMQVGYAGVDEGPARVQARHRLSL